MRLTKLPSFVRQNRRQKARVGEAWRKPRGIDNKQRVQQGGTGALPKIGYRTPNAIRHLVHGHKRVILARNLADVRSAPTDCVIRLSHAMGGKLRSACITAAKERNIHILNA